MAWVTWWLAKLAWRSQVWRHSMVTTKGGEVREGGGAVIGRESEGERKRKRDSVERESVCKEG